MSHRFADIPVAKRLQIGFGAVLAVLIAITALGIVKVSRINEALTANAEENSVIQRHAINFRGSAHDRAIAIRDVVLARTPADRQNEAAAIAELAWFYRRSSAPLEQSIARSNNAAQIRPLYEAIKHAELMAVATTTGVMKAAELGDVETRALLWERAKPAYVQWLAAINRLIDYEEARIQSENRRAQDEADRFLMAMMIALLVAVGLGVALAWQISRSIVLQLGAEPQALMEAARRVAAGDLRPLPGTQVAPTASVLASLGEMQRCLAQVVGQVLASSESITEGSVQIAAGNDDLSERSAQQAISLARASASMARINHSIHRNAESANEATALAGLASAAARRGGAVVDHVIQTMDEISSGSDKISHIIGVIDGIAFQTSILALNASVEAARAGSQGRGFAVVAAEVRTLAQQSAHAAREINSLICSSAQQVKAGTALVSEAGTAMRDIVKQVTRVATLIEEISSTTQQQSENVDQLTGDVSQIDLSTQQNAALVDQSAAAAHNLKHQAMALAKAVQVFQLQMR